MMERRALVVALIAILSAAAAGAVRAQDAAAGSTIAWHFGATGGLAVPMSDLKDGFKAGWQVQPFVTATGGILDLVYLVPTSGAVKPYLFAGPAVCNLKIESEGADYEIVDETRVGVNGGAGLMYVLKSGLGIGVEGAVSYFSVEGAK